MAGNQQRGRDEAGIANRQVELLRDLFRGEIARVDALADHHARIVAQFPIELAVADVDGPHARGAALQQTIGEAAGGASDVQTNLAADIDTEMIQRGSQLDTAAADIRKARGDAYAGCRSLRSGRAYRSSGRRSERRRR